jgi:hypothetical protein
LIWAAPALAGRANTATIAASNQPKRVSPRNSLGA